MVIEIIKDGTRWAKGQILEDIFRNDGQAMIEAGIAKEVTGPVQLVAVSTKEVKMARQPEKPAEQPKAEPKADAGKEK